MNFSRLGRMPLSLLGAGLLSLASAACSQGVDGSQDEGNEFTGDEVVGAVEVNPDVAVQGQPEAEITVNGRKLQLVGPITEPFPARSTDSQYKPSFNRPLSTYTLDELALGMRPIVMRDGYFYSTDEPDYELATTVMEQMHEVNGTVTTPPREGRAIIGTTDDRTYDGANTTGWRRAVLFSEIGCTATMISPSVALTAAHCVFNAPSQTGYTVDREPGAGAGTRSPRWAAAVDGRDADPHPYNASYHSYEVNCNAVPVGPTTWWDSGGNFAASPGSVNYSPNCTSSTTTQPGPWIGCYSAVIHDNYRYGGSSSNWDWDFALIDFSTCGNVPGNYTGFVGVQTLTEAQIEAANGNIWGYPGATGVPGQTSGAQKYTSRYTQWWSGSPFAFEEAELWGTGGTVTLTNSTAVILDYAFDTSGGQSGSLVWRTLNGAMVGYGNHHSGSSSSNHGRRFDSTVLNHATAYTAYPN